MIQIISLVYATLLKLPYLYFNKRHTLLSLLFIVSFFRLRNEIKLYSNKVTELERVLAKFTPIKVIINVNEI